MLGDTGVPGAGRGRHFVRPAGACLISFALLAGGARAATITVTAASDDLTPNDGTVSLREAITAINAGSGLGDPDIIAETPGTFGANDTIHFDIPGAGRHTISVGSTGMGSLPSLKASVTIDGYTQPGSIGNTLATGDNAKVLIALDGADAGAADGLLASLSAPASTIAGLDIFDFSQSQIRLVGGSNILVGNDVGFDTTGAPTRSPVGVMIAASSNNVIGGNSGVAARNVISGNLESGVVIGGSTSVGATGNVVQGNFIGTDASGLHADPNAFYSPNGTLGAVLIAGGKFNEVGGTKPGEGNVISGNGAGVNLTNGAQQNTVQGNLIGLGANGKSPLGNSSYGIRVGSSDNLAPPDGPGQPNEPASSSNTIGVNPTALSSGGANLIAFNGGDGVLIEGTPQNNPTQAQNGGNSIVGNSIFSNHGLGIDLLPEQQGEAPNNLLPAPSVTAVKPEATSSTVQGSLGLAGHGGMSVEVQVFSSPTCGAGGHGQGKTLLSSGTFTTSATQATPFTLQVKQLAPGQIVTATVTNTTADPTVPAGSTNVFDTSEFSKCFTVPKRSTATKVACKPTSVRIGSSTTCTATVTDTAPGHRIPPRGKVHFSSTGKGSFSRSGTCTLSAGRCRVTFRPSAVGSGRQRITAAYAGDVAHLASAGKTTEIVKARKR